MRDDLKDLGVDLWRDMQAMKRREEAVQDLRYLVSQLRARGFSPQVHCDPVLLEVSIDVNLDLLHLPAQDASCDAAIETHLNALGYAGGWSARQDYQLVERHAFCGLSFCHIAEMSASRTPEDIECRYENLMQLSHDEDGVAALLRVLKRRADAS